MNLKLRVWRQKNSSAPGKIEEYEAREAARVIRFPGVKPALHVVQDGFR